MAWKLSLKLSVAADLQNQLIWQFGKEATDRSPHSFYHLETTENANDMACKREQIPSGKQVFLAFLNKVYSRLRQVH